MGWNCAHGHQRVASCSLARASSMDPPSVVVPVSGVKATSPPSSAGDSTAVSSMGRGSVISVRRGLANDGSARLPLKPPTPSSAATPPGSPARAASGSPSAARLRGFRSGQTPGTRTVRWWRSSWGWGAPARWGGNQPSSRRRDLGDQRVSQNRAPTGRIPDCALNVAIALNRRLCPLPESSGSRDWSLFLRDI